MQAKKVLTLAGADETGQKQGMSQSLPQHDEPLPVSGADLMGLMRSWNIDFSLYEHEPVFTVAESTHLKTRIPGLHCRNLFVRDKKEHMFLVVVDNDTPVDLKALQERLGCGRLSFGSPERLWQYLGVRPGSVCPFAIINDKGLDVTLVLEAGMMAADLVCYHPMENHMSVTLTPAALLDFVRRTGHEPQITPL